MKDRKSVGKKMLLVPQYMKDFICNGEECSENCCEINWLIYVDKKTYQKYKKLYDPELTPLLNKHISRNRNQPGEKKYARLDFGKNECCPFLTEKKRCRLQEKMGENYLCDTCMIYPRESNMINNTIEMCASMSCPEAARMALLNPEPMEFEYLENQPEQRYKINISIDTTRVGRNNGPWKYIWELRNFYIDVLQNREYSLEDRLIILGLFTQKLEQTVTEINYEKIPGLINDYIQYINSGRLRESLVSMREKLLNNSSSQFVLQMELLKELSDFRFKYPFVKTKGGENRYLTYFGQFINGIQYTETEQVEEIAERYTKAHNKYYAPFKEEHEYLFENYLVNYVFMHLLPLDYRWPVLDSYVMMVVQYGLIKMLLTGVAAYKEHLDKETAVNLIQSFTTTTENNLMYLKDIFKVLKDKEYNTLPYMVILVNN